MLDRLFVLKRTNVFRDLPEEVLASLAGYLDERHVDAGEAIFRQGDVSRAMYIVVDGQVAIHDDQRPLGMIGPNEVLGERSALTKDVHRASATAAEDCTLFMLDRDLLYEVMAGNPAVARGIIQVLVERLQ